GAEEKELRSVPVLREHDAADDGSDDRADASDAERPAYPGGAHARRIETCGESIRAALRADHAEAGGEYSDHQQNQTGADRAKKSDDSAGEQIGDDEDAVESIAVDEPAEQE